MAKYNNIYQYDEPKMPSNWKTDDERRFFQKLIGIFDDIYLKYGRIGEKLLSDDLRKKINNAINAVKAEEIAKNSATIIAQETVDKALASMEKGLVYSTEEVETGSKWIDGRPVYARILTLKGVAGRALHNIALDVLADMVWFSADGSVCVHSNGYSYPLCCSDANGVVTFTAGYYKPERNVQVYCGTAGTVDFYVRVLYTREADAGDEKEE